MRNQNAEIIIKHKGRLFVFLVILAFFAVILTACGVKKVQVSAVTSGEVRLKDGKPLEISFSAEDTRAMSNYMLEGRFLHSGKTLYGSRHDESGDPYLCRMKYSAGQKGMYVRETEVIDAKTDAKYLLLDNGYLYYLREDRYTGNTSIVRVPAAMGSETKPETLYSESCDFLFRKNATLYFSDASGHLCSMPMTGGVVQSVVSDKKIYYPHLLTEDLLLFQDDADGESLHMRYLPTGFELKISNGRVLCYVVKDSKVWFLRAEESGSEKCRLCCADLNEFLHGFDPTARPDASFQFTIEESSESMGPLFSINGEHINASNYQTADLSDWRSLTDNAWEIGYRAACQYVSEDFEIFCDYNEEGLIEKMLFYEPSVKRRSDIELYKYS